MMIPLTSLLLGLLIGGIGFWLGYRAATPTPPKEANPEDVDSP